MEALRRKLSNVPGDGVPVHPVPGALSFTYSPGILSFFRSSPYLYGFRGNAVFDK